MKKILHFIKNIFRLLGYLVYTMLIVGLMVTGIEVGRIQRDFSYVEEIYAKTVQVEDYTYFYREVGQEHDDTILMIHGFLGSSYDFIDVMNALQNRYRVIAVDMIGFGLSEKSLAFDYAKANQAAYLVKFLDVLGISSVTIMAHSMGGEVSIHLAHDFPQYVNAMILIGSGGYVEPGRSGLMPVDFPLFVYDYVVQNYFIQRTFFFTAYSQYERQSQLITNHDFDEMYRVNRTIPGAVLREFTRDNDSGSTNEKLASITQRTLLIWGEFDGFIPLSIGEKLFEALADVASLVVIPNAGHLPFDTFFNAFMAHVEEFLA